VCAALCLVLFASGCLPLRADAAAPPKYFVLEQAQNLAVAASTAIRKKNSEIVLKGIKYNEAVSGARAKAKNLSTFRWTPLLSFKFPEKFDLVLDYDLSTKPLTLQIEITTLQHEKADLVFTAKKRAASLFTKVYIGQENISFTQSRLDAAKTDLSRNRARLILGTAKQADIDRIEKTVKTLESSLSLAMRTFETDKRALSDLIVLDVTTGYVFKSPLKTADITRAQLASLLAFTLQNDHLYYATRMAESVARITLDSYERLFRGQYGGKVNAISPYLSQARNGNDIDTASFKMAYDNMLSNLDKPWAGKLRILFFTFSFEWFKGPIDGTRYIEDEMYALYTAALDYLSARKDKEVAERDLRSQVASAYESIVTAKNAVDALIASAAETKEELNRLAELNKRGKAEFSELADKQADYQDVQMEAVETLAAYNELLFDFDRLTCGAVTKLLVGTGIATDAGPGGIGLGADLDGGADTDGIDGAGLGPVAGLGGINSPDLPTYHIYSDAADMVFVFGVRIPDDYEPEIDAFEIWYENVRIGERTPIEKELRHLALDYGETRRLTVRLYNGDEYVDECEIDTTVPSDVLTLRGSVPETPQERIVGGYAIDAYRGAGVGVSTLTITANDGAPIAFYRPVVNDVGLLTGELVPISQPFKYLSLDISEARVELFDGARTLLYTARFDPNTMSLRIPAASAR
jgi:multidrug resistance efflux pump